MQLTLANQVEHVEILLGTPLLPPPGVQGEAQNPRCVHWLPNAAEVAQSLRLLNSTVTLAAAPYAEGGTVAPSSDIAIPLTGAASLPRFALPQDVLLRAPVNGSFLDEPGVVADMWEFQGPPEQIEVVFLSENPHDLPPQRTLHLPSMQYYTSTDPAYFTLRMRTVFHAPMDGNYTFLIVGDNHQDLWVGPMENTTVPQNMYRILHMRHGGPFHDYRPNGQPSTPVFLKAGSRLYIEARAIRQAHCGHLSVAVILPNGVILDPIPAVPPVSVPLIVHRIAVPESARDRKVRVVRVQLHGKGSLAVRAIRVFSTSQRSADAEAVIARQIDLRDSLVRTCNALRTGTSMHTIDESVPHSSECMDSEGIKIDPMSLLLGASDSTADVLAQILTSCRFRAAGLPMILGGTGIAAVGLSPDAVSALRAALSNATTSPAQASPSDTLAALRRSFVAALNGAGVVGDAQARTLELLVGVASSAQVNVSLCEDPATQGDASYVVLRVQACLESVRRKAESMGNVLAAMQELSAIPIIANIIANGNVDQSAEQLAMQLVCPSRAPIERRRREEPSDPGASSDAGSGDLPAYTPSRGLQRILSYVLNSDTRIHYSPSVPEVTNLMRLAISPLYKAATVLSVLDCLR